MIQQKCIFTDIIFKELGIIFENSIYVKKYKLNENNTPESVVCANKRIFVFINFNNSLII